MPFILIQDANIWFQNKNTPEQYPKLYRCLSPETVSTGFEPSKSNPAALWIAIKTVNYHQMKTVRLQWKLWDYNTTGKSLEKLENVCTLFYLVQIKSILFQPLVCFDLEKACFKPFGTLVAFMRQLWTLPKSHKCDRKRVVHGTDISIWPVQVVFTQSLDRTVLWRFCCRFEIALKLVLRNAAQ